MTILHLIRLNGGAGRVKSRNYWCVKGNSKPQIPIRPSPTVLWERLADLGLLVIDDDSDWQEEKGVTWEQCPAGRVFQHRVGSGRVLDKILGSGSGSGRVGVSKYMIEYFRVSFLLLGISGYFGYFRVCRVFSGISGFTHVY